VSNKNFRTQWWIGLLLGRKRVLSNAMTARAISQLRLLVTLLVALVVPVSIMLRQPPLHAADDTITVNNLTDPAKTSGNGFCTLREAIDNANAPGTDTTGGDCAIGGAITAILFSVSGTITLGSTLPAVQNNLTIDGSGHAITIDGASLYQVLVVNNGASLSIDGLTIAHGNGGISNEGGPLTVTNSIFSGNSVTRVASGGGAIFNPSYCNSPCPLTISNSTFSRNSAGEFGGAIYNQGGPLTVANSTFSGNSANGTAGGFGGAIENEYTSWQSPTAPFSGTWPETKEVPFVMVQART